MPSGIRPSSLRTAGTAGISTYSIIGSVFVGTGAATMKLVREEKTVYEERTFIAGCGSSKTSEETPLSEDTAGGFKEGAALGTGGGGGRPSMAASGTTGL